MSYPPDPLVLTYTNGDKESHLNNGSTPACSLTGRPEGTRPSPEGKFGIVQGPLPLISSLPNICHITQQVPDLCISTQPNIVSKFCRNGATFLETNSHPVLTVQHETPVQQLGSYLWLSYHKNRLLLDSL